MSRQVLVVLASALFVVLSESLACDASGTCPADILQGAAADVAVQQLHTHVVAHRTKAIACWENLDNLANEERRTRPGLWGFYYSPLALFDISKITFDIHPDNVFVSIPLVLSEPSLKLKVQNAIWDAYEDKFKATVANSKPKRSSADIADQVSLLPARLSLSLLPDSAQFLEQRTDCRVQLWPEDGFISSASAYPKDIVIVKLKIHACNGVRDNAISERVKKAILSAAPQVGFQLTMAYKAKSVVSNSVIVRGSDLRDSQLYGFLDGRQSTAVFVHREDARESFRHTLTSVSTRNFIADPASWRDHALADVVSELLSSNRVEFVDAFNDRTYHANDLHPGVVEEYLNKHFDVREREGRKVVVRKDSSSGGGGGDASVLFGMFSASGGGSSASNSEVTTDDFTKELDKKDVHVGIKGNLFVVKAVYVREVIKAKFDAGVTLSKQTTLITPSMGVSTESPIWMGAVFESDKTQLLPPQDLLDLQDELADMKIRVHALEHRTLQCIMAHGDTGDWGQMSCPAGYILTGGGCDANAAPWKFRQSRPLDTTSWNCGGHGGGKTVFALCCKISA